VTYSARPASTADLPALTALQEEEDVHWFGASEHDESDVRRAMERAEPLLERTRVLLDGDRLVAAAWWWKPDEATCVVSEVGDVPAVYDVLLPWLSHGGVRELEALRQDEQRRAALTRHGWRHGLSQFELARAGAGLPSPRWPFAVTVTSLDDHARAAYRVIYDEAGWAEIPGHFWRGFDEWHDLFVTGEDPTQQVLAWRDGRLVGVALGKIFSDGMGWVAQLAVPKDLQGRGLGSALLAEALRRRLDAGATALGLGVAAANTDALRLYQRVGFEIDREWMRYVLGSPS
jgi:ribosomal protein S18 acetylase RimI-like enzyme